MNVFEELIDELKDEELLEETIFSMNRSSNPVQPQPKAKPNVQMAVEGAPEDSSADVTPEMSAADDLADLSAEAEALDELIEKPVDERETYRRRAMEEVSSLQMVEHVLSGIEREHMKMSPQTYDDLEVKKALHKYLQITAPINSDEHSEAEYKLFQETEKWFSALSKRDANISVANVRRFCENSRPVLSSQALMAMARFYRNSPYSESVRGKFDFVMTKLFAREIGEQRRKLIFGRIEMLGHVKTLYSNWASLSIVAPDEDEATGSVGESVAGFEAFIRESEAAESFDQLIASDFFNRIRLFKEQSNELFYEPAVISAAMECNVRIGNRFIDLVEKEQAVSTEASIEEKYGYSHDTIISHAASKTLLLLDLLRETREAAEMQEAEEAESTPIRVTFERAPVEEKRAGFAVNKWLVALTIVALLVSAGIYAWSESVSTTASAVEVAPAVDLSGTELKQHIREASTSSETLYAVMQPTWDALGEAEQKAFLSEAYDFAKSRGLRKVTFLNNKGRTVAFAADNRSEVFGPGQ